MTTWFKPCRLLWASHLHVDGGAFDLRNAAGVLECIGCHQIGSNRRTEHTGCVRAYAPTDFLMCVTHMTECVVLSGADFAGDNAS